MGIVGALEKHLVDRGENTGLYRVEDSGFNAAVNHLPQQFVLLLDGQPTYSLESSGVEGELTDDLAGG